MINKISDLAFFFFLFFFFLLISNTGAWNRDESSRRLKTEKSRDRDALEITIRIAWAGFVSRRFIS